MTPQPEEASDCTTDAPKRATDAGARGHPSLKVPGTRCLLHTGRTVVPQPDCTGKAFLNDPAARRGERLHHRRAEASSRRVRTRPSLFESPRDT